MASPFELVAVSSTFTSGAPVPVSDAVIGTTTHTGMDFSLYGDLKRTQYAWLTTVGTTYILSTAAQFDSLYIVPISSGAGAFTLADGTTTILTIPAAAHVGQPQPISVPLGIRNTSTAGFKVVLGASVACLAIGSFVGAVTTA